MPKSQILKHRGEPAVFIDGKPYPPMTVTVETDDPGYLKRLRDSGIRIFYVPAITSWGAPAKDGKPCGTEITLNNISSLLEAVPDAYIILRLNINPSEEWINSHPEEQVLFNDGSHEKVLIAGCSNVIRADGMVSFASEKWKEDGQKAIAEFFDEISHSPYYGRIIGAFLCGGGTEEWYYPGEHRMKNTDKGTYADFSEPFRKSYSGFLRKKYGTEEKLRSVWKIPDATFESPKIPDLSDREYINLAEGKILDAMMHWECAGSKVDHDAKGEKNLGVFLNVNEYAYTSDFFDALNQATADTLIHFSKVFKDISEDFLVGTFYGYFGCCDYYEASHCTGVHSLIKCGYLDFLAGPGTYNNREPGGVVAQREMQDSLRLHNMIYICEDDARTHLSTPDIQREQMRLYSVKDSLETLKRDFARDICEEVQGWWIGIGGTREGSGIYDHPDILSLFKRQQEIGELSYSLDRSKKNEIAIIYDTDSVHLVSDYTNKMVLDFFRTSDIHRIGAPVDYYFHDDMDNPDMPDYKLYIMLNTYCLTDQEREAVYAKASRNHAFVLWMYAPGLENFNGDTVMDVSNIEKTVGMKVKMLDRTIFPRFYVNPQSHPALSLADKDRIYGFIDRNVHSNIWTTYSELYPDYANPGFVIEESDGITVLGRYCTDGSVAFAIRECGDYASAYCCTQVMQSSLIASVARYAGCHIYTDSEDVLYANENFVALHASFTGKRRLHFKKSCSPYELYEKKYYAKDTDCIEVEMELGETKMFLVSDASV